MEEKLGGQRPRAVVVIPTYNEAESIGRMIDHLFSQTIPSIRSWDVAVLVVDGNSPDGTAGVVRSRMAQGRALDLLVETKKEGIGAAYFKGFEHAARKMGADVLVEFDGDFQHPPETLPVLLSKIDEGYDCVVGSRNVPGGAYPKGWGFKRRFFSIVGGFVARLLLFFPTLHFWKVTDPTTGLKATRVKGPFQSLDFAAFSAKGFGYKVEMLFRLLKAGARFAEIPLHFQLRDEGESKMTSETPKEIFATVLGLRMRDEDTRRFVKFGIVGFSGMLVNSLLLELFYRSGVGGVLARLFSPLAESTGFAMLSQGAAWGAALSAECSIINNFVFNNAWTFVKRNAKGRLGLIPKFFMFNLTSLGAVILQFLGVGTAGLLFDQSMLVRQASLVATILFLVVPYNWFMYNKVIWRKGIVA